MEKHFKSPEGATPITDCSGLIPQWVHNMDDLNRVEAENILQAQIKYLRPPVANPKNWFQLTELKNIHHTMYGKVWHWAGQYRNSITSIGIRPGLIPMRLSEFCFEVVSWLENPVELTFLEMAARIHHQLVLIHPFENGNGRFSRLISDRFLLAFKLPHSIWPHNLNREGIDRNDYIQTLKNADNGDYIPLINFMKKLGARDPKFNELFKEKIYQDHLKNEKGIALAKALLRAGGNPNDETQQGHRSLELATKAGLNEIAKLLVSAGAD